MPILAIDTHHLCRNVARYLAPGFKQHLHVWHGIMSVVDTFSVARAYPHMPVRCTGALPKTGTFIGSMHRALCPSFAWPYHPQYRWSLMWGCTAAEKKLLPSPWGTLSRSKGDVSPLQAFLSHVHSPCTYHPAHTMEAWGPQAQGAKSIRGAASLLDGVHGQAPEAVDHQLIFLDGHLQLRADTASMTRTTRDTRAFGNFLQWASVRRASSVSLAFQPPRRMRTTLSAALEPSMICMVHPAFMCPTCLLACSSCTGRFYFLPYPVPQETLPCPHPFALWRRI